MGELQRKEYIGLPLQFVNILLVRGYWSSIQVAFREESKGTIQPTF